MPRMPWNQTVHDRKVSELANQLSARGAAVNADVPGWPQPGVILGYRPDIHAVNGGELVVEVETTDSVNDQHSLNQRSAFETWARQAPWSRRFELIVAR